MGMSKKMKRPSSRLRGMKKKRKMNPKTKPKKMMKTKKSTTVSPVVKEYVKKVVDASNPDMRIQMYNPVDPIKRAFNGLELAGNFNAKPRTDIHFFLHNPSSPNFESRAGMNIPEQIGLRHIENRLDLDALRIGQLVGTNVKLKSLYIKGRYLIDQTAMESLSVPELHIRTMVLEDKEKSYEELLTEFNTPLYTSTTSNSETNPKAGLLYKLFRDPTGYTVVNREDQESSGYLWPHASRMCRAFPDMYAMDLPLNTSSFKYLGGTRKKVTVGNWKPVYDNKAEQIKAVSPSNAPYEIPFSFRIKHPGNLRWDNSHKRVVFRDIDKNAITPGPQNFTPFLVSFVNSPNSRYYDKVSEGSAERALDDLVKIQYSIYASVDAKPLI